MSRRSKIIVVVDLIVLAVLAIVGAAMLITSHRDSSPSEPRISTPGATSSAPTHTRNSKPFQSAEGLAWIVAGCGSPTLLDDDRPNSLLPHSTDWAICLVPSQAPPVLVGLYADRPALEGDLARTRGQYRSATRADAIGNFWVFLVEGNDATPLRSLERYGFVVG